MINAASANQMTKDSIAKANQNTIKSLPYLIQTKYEKMWDEEIQKATYQGKREAIIRFEDCALDFSESVAVREKLTQHFANNGFHISQVFGGSLSTANVIYIRISW